MEYIKSKIIIDDILRRKITKSILIISIVLSLITITTSLPSLMQADLNVTDYSIETPEIENISEIQEDKPKKEETTMKEQKQSSLEAEEIKRETKLLIHLLCIVAVALIVLP